MKWGISTSFLGSFKRKLKLGDVSIMKNSGIDVVELKIDYLPNNEFFIISLLNELTSRRLKVHSIHVPDGLDLSSPEDRIRKQAVSEVKESIDLLVKAKGHIIVVHPASVKAIKNNKERVSRILRSVESLREISEYCQKEKVKVAIENLIPANQIYNSPEELMHLINTCGSENMGICLDTGHANSNGNLTEMLEICGSHIIALHINDNHKVVREKYKVINDEHLLPFEGDIDWDGFIKELKKINYRGVFIFEPQNRNEMNLGDFLKKIKDTYQKLERLTKSDW